MRRAAARKGRGNGEASRGPWQDGSPYNLMNSALPQQFSASMWFRSHSPRMSSFFTGWSRTMISYPSLPRTRACCAQDG